MSNKVRVPFPRYLNAKKLFYKWEYDVVVSAIISFVIFFVVQIWLSIAILVALFTSGIAAYFIMQKYVKFFKKTRKGFISHLGYSYGYKDPLDRTKIKEPYEEYLIPKGFENEFRD